LEAGASFWFKRMKVVDVSVSPAKRSCPNGTFKDDFNIEVRMAADFTKRPFDAVAPLRVPLEEFSFRDKRRR
jgi:hypothetical protein